MRPAIRERVERGAARLGARLRRHELDARRRARGGRASVPVAHVEAGLRSGDLVDAGGAQPDRGRPARRAAPLPGRALARARSRARASPGRRRGRRRRDGRRDAARFAPIARERSRSSRGSARAGRVRRRDDPPRGERASRSGCARIVDGARPRSSEPVVFPAHPRTRARARRARLALAPNVDAIEPLGYLDMPRSPRRRASIVTDSGGLQKEAYWYGVPVRDAAAVDRVGRHGRGGRERARRRRPRAARRGGRAARDARPSGRRSTATATPPNASQPLCTLDAPCR